MLKSQNISCVLLSRSPSECVDLCDNEEGCTMWTWTRGKCFLMSGSNWTKAPEAGSISGVAGLHQLADPVTGWFYLPFSNIS